MIVENTRKRIHKSTSIIKSYYFLLIGLLPLWPAIKFIDKNKNEQVFDVLWLLLTFSFVLMILACVYILGRFFRSHVYGVKLFVLASVSLCFFQFYFDIKVMLTLEENIAASLAIFGLLVLVVASISWNIAKSKTMLSIIAVYATIITTLSIFPLIQDPGIVRIDFQKATSAKVIKVKEASGLPNVYYFIFDGYLRSDLLKRYYGYSNDEFVNKLKNEGFHVDTKSRSNFPTTRYSLNYIMNPSFGNITIEKLPKLLHSNRSFTGYDHSEIENDFYARGYNFTMMNHLGVDVPVCSPNCITTEPSVTFVQIQFLKNTPIYDVIKNYFPGILWSWVSKIPNDNRYSLDNFPPNIAKPFILFSHALIPHPPYSVNADCSPMKAGVIDFNLEFKKDWDNLRQRYLDQVSCANRQMLEIVDRLNKTDNTAIIFFVSDHGWKGNHAMDIPKDANERDKLYTQTRISNFMAVRAPESCLKYYEEGMTLVNSFPFIFACIDKIKPNYIAGKSFFINEHNHQIEDRTSAIIN